MLQIGVCYGQSVAAWAAWLPEAEVLGVDLAPWRFLQNQPRLLAQGLPAQRVTVFGGHAGPQGLTVRGSASTAGNGMSNQRRKFSALSVSIDGRTAGRTKMIALSQ